MGLGALYNDILYIYHIFISDVDHEDFNELPLNAKVSRMILISKTRSFLTRVLHGKGPL